MNKVDCFVKRCRSVLHSDVFGMLVSIVCRKPPRFHVVAARLAPATGMAKGIKGWHGS